MELFLPIGIVRGDSEEQTRSDRARADQSVTRLINALDAAWSSLAEVATEDGARNMAAASFLRRATDLLKEIRRAAETPIIATLGIRSAFELVAVGRYLLGPDGSRRYRLELPNQFHRDQAG